MAPNEKRFFPTVEHKLTALALRLVSRNRCLLAGLTVSVLTGCGVPNLEPAECTAARTPLREFYSFHFGNEMKFSPEGLEMRKRFLSPSLAERVRDTPEGIDPFTSGNADVPKAFRAGECRVLEPDRTQFDVILFWRDDERSEQRSLKIDMAKTEGGWLVDWIERDGR